MPWVISVSLLLLSAPLYSQQPAHTARALNDAAFQLYDQDRVADALRVAEEARHVAERLQEKEELSRTYFLLGNIRLWEGSLSESRLYYRKSLQLARATGDTKLQSKIVSAMASALSQLGEYDSAEQRLLESIRLSSADTSLLITNYGRLGVNRKRQQHYAVAIDYYFQSLNLSRGRGDSISMARTLANIGNIYFEQKEYDRALQHYQEALGLLDSARYAFSISGISVFAADAYQAMGRLDEAEHLLLRALRSIRKMKRKGSEAYAIQSLGIVRGKQHRWNEALEYFQQALALYRTLDSWRDLESVLLDLSQAYTETKQYEQASTAMKEGIALAEKHKHASGLKEFYASLAKLDSLRGHYKDALAHFQRSVYYRDTLFTVEKASAIEAVNKKYTALQKEKIIEEQQRIINQHQTTQAFILALVSVVIVSAVPVVLFIRRKRRMEHGLLQERQRKENLMSIVWAQEQMQQKIARDLHDSLVQVLSGAKIGVESLRADIANPVYAGKLRETTDIIDQACHEARAIAHYLLPYSLQRHGLLPALEELFEKNVRRVVGAVDFNHYGLGERLKDTVEINVYRIVQELMNNVIKHAAADRLTISLMKQDGQLILIVSDNGRGFSTEMQKGAGLMNIETRLQVLQGTLEIESMPGKGVTTTIRIPL